MYCMKYLILKMQLWQKDAQVKIIRLWHFQALNERHLLVGTNDGLTDEARRTSEEIEI